MATTKSPKIPKNFVCDICDYNTSNKKDYNKHLMTLKHNLATSSTKKSPKIPAAYSCKQCNKTYKDRTGLWRHKQRCVMKNDCVLALPSEEIDYKGLLFKALSQLEQQQNDLRKKDELMGQMLNKVGTTNITNHNNQFNINMFLNEQCKNAINLSEFIDRIEVSHDDLENNAQLGFVNGMTKILLDNLKQLTIYERPIHCTDVKRETLYIKYHNVWDKEQSVEKLENAIQEVSRKSIKSLLDWKKINPEYENMDSEFSKKCIPMQQNSMALCNKESFYPKIIHNLAKESSISQLK